MGICNVWVKTGNVCFREAYIKLWRQIRAFKEVFKRIISQGTKTITLFIGLFIGLYSILSKVYQDSFKKGRKTLFNVQQ